MTFWTDLFGTEHSLTLGQECVRAVLIFVYGLLLVRLAGRRLFGKWAALDIIVAVLIGSNLSRALTGGAPLAGTLAATTLLVFLHWLISQAAARSRILSRLVEGRGVELVRDGKIDSRVAAWHSVSRADIDEALRRTGIQHIEDAARVTLEPSGNMTTRQARDRG